MTYTHNHPQGGRSIEVTATNGSSAPVTVGLLVGLTLTANSGTAKLWQTSSSLSAVQSGTAAWEEWALGTASSGTSVHGLVQCATAVYVQAIGGTAVLGIRD